VDAIAEISYKTEEEVARFDVGDQPQRVRDGRGRAGWLAPRHVGRRC
jgi:hypothetical protein